MRMKLHLISLKKFTLLATATLLHFCVSGKDADGKVKNKNESPINSATIASQSTGGFTDHLKISARQYNVIINRDSYADAANSFGGSGHGGNVVGNSFKTPQDSYVVPSQGGYEAYGMQQQGGYYNLDDNSQPSKGGADLLGLVGLLGLTGLKGTLPVIKMITFTLIALSPILVPLSILKLVIILLKPVIPLGRNTKPVSDISNNLDNYVERFAERLRSLKVHNLKKNYNWNETKPKIDKLFERDGVNIANEVLGRGSDDRCMERISCEGLFKTIPRIFFKILGDNYNSYKIRRRNQRINSNEKGKALDSEQKDMDISHINRQKRKDLASLALYKLKNRQYLTKQTSLTETPESSEQACQQYKCLVLF